MTTAPRAVEVRVRYFAAAAEAAGCEEETLVVSSTLNGPGGAPGAVGAPGAAGAAGNGGTATATATQTATGTGNGTGTATGSVTVTVGDLRARLVERHGQAMARVIASGSFLVDGIVSRDDARALGARVDVLPPFAGG